MPRQHLGNLVIVGLLASGCFAQAQAPRFDGVYLAPAGGASGNARCGTTRFGYPLRVKDGVASLQTVSAGKLEGPVGADGSVSVQSGAAFLAGKIAGSHFSGTLTIQSCLFDLQYDKR